MTHLHLHLHLHGNHRCKTQRRGRGRGSQRARKLSLPRATLKGARRTRTESTHRCRWRTRTDRERIILPCLCSKETLGGGAMAFALSILFEGILNRDALVHEELVVHSLDGGIRGLEVGVRDKPVAL